ncbi:PREDICTED: probable tyrosine-protein phosphatase F54C8.4 [Polistes dominula]|uniref:Probable tyrosine-protein phosphatase F54C8.4 n=1 Tax=Polistes dominula TaxID=743375 RepID=A0ABM1HZM4_POLDO|nr:PREDICTED: probable tyrosine-protein phosphatase F54C8.4 [Polistes dominula]
MGKTVPEGWLEYKPYGDVVKGTKILPFKVPLKEAIVQNVKPEERFTASMILQAYPRLKFIVDLTNTDRYYDKSEFTSAGVKHTKITIPGKKVPSLNSVMKFFDTMDNFMATAGEDDVIGVHCTHGINRTGYLICRYLIEKQGWELQDSIKAFQEARGYPIYRDEYITALKKISRGEKKKTLNRSINTRKDSIPIRNVLDQYKLRIRNPKGRPAPYPMGPSPGYKPHRRGFTNGAYLPQPFGFGAPPHGFGSMPPHPPGMPPPPPGPPMYGPPRPMRFGLPLPPPPPPAMRAPMPPLPPGPDFRRSVVNSGFHPPAFPNRLPGPSRMSGPPRLPPGPQSRLPPPKMPPPPPPPPPQVRQVSVKRLQGNKKKQQQQPQIRNGMAVLPRSSMRLTRREVSTTRRNVATKMIKEQDFTADTFEENLLAVSSTNSHLRRSTTKGRYHQTK